MGDQTATVVWRRRYDEAKHKRSMQRFVRFYAVPAGFLVVIAGLFGGFGAAAGTLILFGLFGLLLFLWVWLSGRNERANPTVTKEGGQLLWARRQVPINQVTRFSTYMTSSSMSVGGGAIQGGATARVSLGAARFALVDGSETDFVWAGLDEEQLLELRAALEDELPGRWRSVEELRITD